MEDQKEPTIVILGDWYIDENWLVSKLESYHSSAPGDIHYMALHQNANNRITNLCAAAGLLVALRSYLIGELGNIPLSFLAFGVWNPRDNELFTRAVCPDSEVKLLSPYTLSESREKSSACRDCTKGHKDCIFEKTLINLAEEVAKDRKSVSTNRIIRCFEGQSRGMPHQLYRFDWMLPCTLDDKHWEKIGDTVKERDIKAVIIVDHGAGVVNNSTIRQLVKATEGKNVPWFMHTKMDNPAWLQELKHKKIRLEMNVMDFHLAIHLKGTRRWWHGERMGRSALELLGEMTGEKTYQDQEEVPPKGLPWRSSFVLLEDNTVFGMAKLNPDDRPQCVSIARPIGQRQPVTLGRTTLFCAALFAQRLKSMLSSTAKHKLTRAWVSQLKEECNLAACTAYDWTRQVSRRWGEEKLSLHELYPSLLKDMDVMIKTMDNNCVNTDYYDEWEYWNESSRNFGIVSEKEKALHLWRGEGILKDYICVGGPKRTAINELVSAIAKFLSSKNPQHPFSCLIQSPPGWGKSFLARCLASYFDLEFLDFSVAQMCDDRDIMDCFAAIASVQSRTQKQTLVFIDEVNAEIQGHTVMSSLLSPLWEGTFVKDRQTFRLKPGVWVFASTSAVTKLAEDENKGSDFLSRLNGPIIDLDSPDLWRRAIAAVKDVISTKGTAELEIFKEEVYRQTDYKRFKNYEKTKRKKDDHRTEQVYLMVSLLNNLWGPINSVERKVLRLFHDLLPINGYRSLELFAGCFEGIERGRVIAANVPRLNDYTELRRHVIVPEWWDEDEKKSPAVKIETRYR